MVLPSLWAAKATDIESTPPLNNTAHSLNNEDLLISPSKSLSIKETLQTPLLSITIIYSPENFICNKF